MEGMFVSPQVFFLEHDFQVVSLDEIGQDDSLAVHAHVRVVQVVPLQHLQEQHAACRSDRRKFIHLSGALLSVRVDCALQDDQHFVVEVPLQYGLVRLQFVQDL